MFYSQFILAKKGPLGTIWIAAHLERKLRKNQVAETDIGVTVDNILFPEVPIALRLSGHLLLGVVRIYSRQVNYLFNDCSETLGKIKQAFHSAAVDLPPEATTAPFHSITLPETFDFDELELAPDSESSFLHSNGKYVDHHVTTREQITLQDCIENNPYLGSSQFGLDERFGDGSYSSLDLDFDEEFWTSKAGSSSIPSTSTPLLKEDTIVPPAGAENEVTHMDVDDPYEQPLESELQKGKSIKAAVNTEAGQIEGDNQLNTSIPAISSVPFNEPSGVETTSSKDSDFAALKHDTPSVYAYTPRVLEACTPDLNQEYCPPDEPSTPALAEETSFPMYKECNAESAVPFSPVMLGNTERSFPPSLSPQQVSCAIPSAASVQATKIPSSASFQGFPLQQAAPVEANREAILTQKEQGEIFSVKENAASASMAFQSSPQLTLMQQTRIPVSHEGAIFQSGTSYSFLTSPEPPLPSVHQRDGNLSMTMNRQPAGTVNQDVYPSFQPQGVAAGPVSSSGVMAESSCFQQQGVAAGPVSSFGAMAESSCFQQQGVAAGPVSSSGAMAESSCFQQQGVAAGPVSSSGAMVESSISQPPSTMRNIVASQVLASPFVSKASVIPSFSASSGSLSPITNVPLMGGVENMNSDKEASHQTLDLAASKSLLQQPAAQQPIMSPLAESSISQPFSTMQNIVASQVLASPFVSKPSIIPSFSASSGSLLPITNVPLMGGVENTNSDKGPSHRTLDSAASKSPLRQPAAQQPSMSPLAESSIPQPFSTMQNIVSSQVLASSFVSKPSIIPSFSASSRSLLPITNVPSMVRVENMNSDKEASHGTLDSAASKSLLRQPAAQQPSMSPLAESSIPQPFSTMQNIVASQVLASPFMSKPSIIPSFSASSGSRLPITNVPPMGGVKNMNSDKEAPHETLDSAASKSLLRQPAAQHFSMSPPAAMPGILSSMNMGECETLRSAYDLQAGRSGFLMLQKDMSDERTPGLELERNKFFSVGTNRITKESILPAMDKTPILREETPYMFARAPFLSTHSIESLPADDDVLASILGRRTAFKVVSTPKGPKEPKLNVAKRPKRAPRVTPKKRKIDFDTVAVLHGDVIRQQLANAEDIRRERRKAPCTRREVWGFIRESEGQENFDEPTLPELSPYLHDLYHDVLHGPESRPLSSAALNGAVKANQTSEPQLIRSGEIDCVAGVVNNDANELDPRGDSHHLVDCVNKDSSRDTCMNEFVGSGENSLPENVAEQLKEDVKLEIAQTNPCGGSMEAEDVEKSNVEAISKPEAVSEGLDGKERDISALSESRGPEEYIPTSMISRETEANEQGAQSIGLDKEVEGTGQAQEDILVSSHSENVVGVIGADVGDEGITMTVQKDVVNVVGADVGSQEKAMAVQQDTESLEQQQQLSFGVNEHIVYEGEGALLGKEADSKALDIPSDKKDATEALMLDGKDAPEVLIVQVVDVEKGNVEDIDKLPTSNVSEEERNLCRNDEEMTAMECERDTDFLDEDNDVAYAEIDYSSDEQDTSIQDSNGWSARSRNVGRYLKTLFGDMEGNSKRLEQGPTLGLERLLARKTKREAARMFFETLVLKTKDYIHVEQNIAYQDIHLYPKSKLMKTEF